LRTKLHEPAARAALAFALIASPICARPADAQSEASKELEARLQLAVGAGLGGLAAALPAARRRCNKLIDERSPYLLQHAWNPVAWYPWGPEPFARARRENKPVFLSVGYSTCHWCHVMERESFESYETAALLNRDYICVKLDREERPDLDEAFMAAVQAFNDGHGGWPMSLFLTPKGKPYVGGTYFPPDRFRSILERLAALWRKDSKGAVDQAKQLVDYLRRLKAEAPDAHDLSAAICDAAADSCGRIFDPVHGGFGDSGPKFPRGMTALFLLQVAARDPARKVVSTAMVTKTLDAMAAGGIYDHLGGGFHRYATDRAWLIPHFEKMLYDNGILLSVYSEAYRATGRSRYLEVARETAAYLLRDMQLPHGGLASAEDADSEGEEGLFYVWTDAQLKAELEPLEARLFALRYGVSEGGNFPELPKHSVLSEVRSLEDCARSLKLDLPRARSLLNAARTKLKARRDQRIHPLRDDKVITAWNGLALSGLANLARLVDDPALITACRRLARFALTRLRRSDGRLLRRYRGGDARFLGVLDDYAYLTAGLLELARSDPDPAWLEAALELESETRRLFWDEETNGFYRTATDVKDLLVRSRDASDGARPSAAAIAALNMLNVAELRRDAELRARALRFARNEATRASRAPLGYVGVLSLVERLLAPGQEILICGSGPQASALRRQVDRRYLPRAVVVRLPEDQRGRAIRALLPKLTEGRGLLHGQASAWVCQDMTCEAPATSPAALGASLDRSKP
jgi:uncharacterized protein